jgi:hypothetical protein
VDNVYEIMRCNETNMTIEELLAENKKLKEENKNLNNKVKIFES